MNGTLKYSTISITPLQTIMKYLRLYWVALFAFLPSLYSENSPVFRNAEEWLASASISANPEFYENKVLPVPAAMNYGGTFPTCAAMLLMYHNDTLGIFPEGVDNFLTQEALDIVASPGYWQTIFQPDDRESSVVLADASESPTFRTATSPTYQLPCIAGVCGTSQSFNGLRAGQSFLSRGAESGTYQISSNYNGILSNINVELGAVGALYTFIGRNRLSGSESPYSFVGAFMAWYGEAFWRETGEYVTELDPVEVAWLSATFYIDRGHPYMGITRNSPYGIKYLSETIVVCGYATDGVHRAVAYYDTSSYELKWRFIEDDFIQGEVSLTFRYAGGDDEWELRNKFDEELQDGVVHRFYRADTGAYFFTASKAEAQALIDANTVWQYQNPVFKVEYGKTDENLPVYRFYNKKAGAHFYTMSEEEKTQVIANLSDQLSYEGIAFFCSPNSRPFDSMHPEIPANYPVYRCFLPNTSSHYFTGSQSEIDFIQNNIDPSLIRVEGVAWYSDMVYDKQ